MWISGRPASPGPDDANRSFEGTYVFNLGVSSWKAVVKVATVIFSSYQISSTREDI